MKVTYPISTDDGDEYLVLIESFEKSILPDDIIEMLNNIEIVDITLERVSGVHATKPDILFEISNFVAGFLLDNENTILYFYCDDMHDIVRRNQSLTPQKFRSDLFSKMFERYSLSHEKVHFVLPNNRGKYLFYFPDYLPSHLCETVHTDKSKRYLHPELHRKRTNETARHQIILVSAGILH